MFFDGKITFPNIYIYILQIKIFVLGKTRNSQIKQCPLSRTTDAQRGNSPYCTAENSIPIPNL